MEKKNLDPNSAHTWPRQENSDKNSEKIQKIKKPLSGNIFTQNRMRKAKKERKKTLFTNSIQTRPGQENSEKNCKKIQSYKKPLSSVIFS